MNAINLVHVNVSSTISYVRVVELRLSGSEQTDRYQGTWLIVELRLSGSEQTDRNQGT
mgnify:CR=1 FL=1